MNSHNLVTLGITTEQQYRSARGNMKQGEFKGVKFSPEDIERLDKQAKDRGWLSDGVVDEEPIIKDVDDLAIAEYYVYKAKNAKQRGLEFTLSLSEFRSLAKRKRCYYSNIILTRDGSDTTFTIDRIDNSKGYTKENSVPCARFVNNIKNELLENDRSRLKTDLKTLKRIVSRF